VFPFSPYGPPLTLIKLINLSSLEIYSSGDSMVGSCVTVTVGAGTLLLGVEHPTRNPNEIIPIIIILFILTLSINDLPTITII
jgi:hypothetical protein